MRSYYEILAVINSALNVIHRIRKIRKIPNSQYLDDFQESLYIFTKIVKLTERDGSRLRKMFVHSLRKSHMKCPSRSFTFN